MKLTGENRSTGRKTCPSVTLSTTNPTWTDQGLSPGLLKARPVPLITPAVGRVTLNNHKYAQSQCVWRQAISVTVYDDVSQCVTWHVPLSSISLPVSSCTRHDHALSAVDKNWPHYVNKNTAVWQAYGLLLAFFTKNCSKFLLKSVKSLGRVLCVTMNRKLQFSVVVTSFRFKTLTLFAPLTLIVHTVIWTFND